MVAIRPGGRETLRLVDLPIPRPGPDEILVRVKALGLNPVDVKIRGGYRAEGRSWPLPLGWDVAGVVEQIGQVVTRFKPGDEIFYCGDLTHPGASADYHLVNQRLATLKPASLSFVEAASLPLVGSTMLQGLGRQARLVKGETVAIFGAAGGIGGMGVMLARSMGARVIGVCSGHNTDYLRELGADEVIDYTRVDPVKAIRALTGGRGAEVVVDTVGGEGFQQAIESLAPFGRLLFLNAFPENAPPLSALNPLRLTNGALHCVMVVPSGELMGELAEHIDKGTITPKVEQVLPLERLADGHARLESRHGRGKVVIELDMKMSESIS
ncbi:MAG: NADP-dependent oxidoreductase [Nitrospinae bacterium]|nr:NADP-dependent oxidoreductase [Nitrospinota bacterium]